MGFNKEVNSMFIGDFINMSKRIIGEESYKKMINEIGIFILKR